MQDRLHVLRVLHMQCRNTMSDRRSTGGAGEWGRTHLWQLVYSCCKLCDREKGSSITAEVSCELDPGRYLRGIEERRSQRLKERQ
jgi:hypothetical protein